MHYDVNPDPNTLYQGDIIDKFILPDPPEEALIVRPSETTQLPLGQTRADEVGDIVRVATPEQLRDAFSRGREAIVVSATLTRVAIISQSCDIQRKPFATVAAVRAMRLIHSDQKKADIRRIDRKLEYFWLPAHGDFEESFVDLTLVYSVRRETLVLALPNRILSLSENWRHNLQWAIIQYFGRPADS
jgi:hypothetical protein